MSVMSASGRSTEQLLGNASYSPPRVNLLPPEIGERRRLRQTQIGLGAAVLATVGVVSLLYVGASSSVGTAQEQVTASSAVSQQLRAETARYSDVTAVYTKAAAAQAMLTQAMGQEVRFSQLMSDVSLTVPGRVWITSLAFSQEPVQPAVGSTEPGIGTMTVAGVGFSHDDVAVWLDALGGQANYVNPYFSNSTEALIGTRTVVNFASTATLTSKAFSGTYSTPAGG